MILYLSNIDNIIMIDNGMLETKDIIVVIIVVICCVLLCCAKKICDCLPCC